MPFKLKLKKTRQYNVVSKSMLVISIELLDGSNVECTLSSESLGKECFDHVCQRALISQPEFFGLRYINKEGYPKWVDMDLHLKKQLDKYASSTTLHLRVMYYVISGITLITDEMTRYHYFLHLKNDVVEGRIVCDFNQAVLLACYSRQAEYGNHDSETNNVERLKKLLTFPKHLVESGQLEALTEAVIHQQLLLQNMSQAAAEEYYIATCQQLDGYGQETFVVRDDTHKEVILGISVLGIVVSSSHSQTIKWYRWTDISNVINNKRTFTIECSEVQDTISFQFNDVESAKYVWKLCVLQHTFYMKYEQHVQFKTPDTTNLFITAPEDPVITESRETVDNMVSPMPPFGSNANLNLKAHSTSNLDLSLNPDADRISRVIPSQYHIQSDYDIQNSQLNQNYQSPASDMLPAYGSQPEIHCQSTDNNIQSAVGNYYKPLERYPDVTHHTSQKNLTESHIDNINTAGGIKKVSWRNQLDEKAYTNTMNREPNFQRIDVPYNTSVDNLIHGIKLLHLYKPPPPYPTSRLCSNSTPDLASQRMNMPLHPFVSHVSGSSPDLVSSRTMLNHQLYLNSYGQSLSNQHLEDVAYFRSTHGTYENLDSFSDNIIPYDKRYRDNSSITKHIQKIYDDRGNVIYCMPRNIEQIVENQIKNVRVNPVKFNQSGAYNQPAVNSNGETEPIYENVPLPWQNESGEMRNRTHSIQSAPGLMRFADKKNNQPILKEEETIIAMIHPQPANSANPHNINKITSTRSDYPIYKEVLTNSQQNLSTSNNVSDLNLYDHALELNKMQNKHLNHSAQNLNDMGYSIRDFREEFSNFKMNATRLNKIQSLIELPIVQNDIIKVTKAESFNNNTMLPKHSESSKLNHQMMSLIDKNKSLNRSTSHIEQSNSSLFKSQTLHLSHCSSQFEDTNTRESSLSSANSGKEKKKWRWGLLGVRSKSSEKIKSATLGRGKERDKQSHKDGSSRHRWSTGLPRLHPLPPTISKEALCQLLEIKLGDTKLFYEFEHIPKRKGANNFNSSSKSENISRVPKTDCIPYEENRVRITPSKDNRTGFVNASHVTASVGSKQLFYICAESPSLQSIEFFLQCVWEADVYLVVQLPNSDDFHYLPITSNRCQEYGQYQVWREYSQDNGQCVTSKLRLYQLCSHSYRSVWHLQYAKWSQEECPQDVGHFLGFLEELCSVRQQSILEVPIGHNRNPPVLVHCPTGGVRSGLTIACHLLLYTLDYNQELDIPRVIGLLRQQQANILPSLTQYKFLYKVLEGYGYCEFDMLHRENYMNSTESFCEKPNLPINVHKISEENDQGGEAKMVMV